MSKGVMKGNTIKIIREFLGYSQNDMAIELGMSKHTLINWEMGDTAIVNQKMAVISEYFMIPEFYLCGEITDDKREAIYQILSQTEFVRAFNRFVRQPYIKKDFYQVVNDYRKKDNLITSFDVNNSIKFNLAIKNENLRVNEEIKINSIQRELIEEVSRFLILNSKNDEKNKRVLTMFQQMNRREEGKFGQIEEDLDIIRNSQYPVILAKQPLIERLDKLPTSNSHRDIIKYSVPQLNLFTFEKHYDSLSEIIYENDRKLIDNNLINRAFNIFERHGLKTVQEIKDFVGENDYDSRNCRNIGEKTYNAIKELIKKYETEAVI